MRAFSITTAAPKIHTTFASPTCSLHASSPAVHTNLSSWKTHHHQASVPFSSTIFNQPNSLSATTGRRRLLCKTPFGKYVREDYLVEKLSAKEIRDLIKGERTVPLIIDFYATWCGPCILMAQELEMLAVEYESDALIVKVDTDDEYEFAGDMQVRGLPTLYFISPDPNKDAIRTEGLIPIQMMRNIIHNEM